ncbi:MAG: hypothetical protein Q9160_002987 [Pyrenula sp. 1 TL-2023]
MSTNKSILPVSQNNNNGHHPTSSRFASDPDPPEKWPIYRAHIVAMTGEFVGTFLFLYFAFGGTQAAAMATTPSDQQTPQRLLYISLSFGMSLAVSAWAFYRISGGLFNPAVILGLCLSGGLPWTRGAFLFPAQIAGSIVATALNSATLPGMGPEDNITKLSGGTSIAQGVFIEMFLTSLLVFVILMLAAEKSRATFIAPIGIGLALFVIEMTGVFYTGGSVNPARSLGPSVVAGSFPGYHWIYWVGPCAGAILASGYYRLAKFLNYEEANPGQDAQDEEEAGEALRQVESRRSQSSRRR